MLFRSRGLTTSHPILGWGLVIGVIAILGFPPLGVFMSEFLLVSSAFAHQPWIAVILAIGLLIALGAMSNRLIGMAFGEPNHSESAVRASVLPLYIHLLIVLIAGVYLPQIVVISFQNIAKILG